MEIMHHVNVHSSLTEFYNYVVGSSIRYVVSDYPVSNAKLLSFDISESDPRWETVYALLKKYEGFDIYRGGDLYDTAFTEKEIRNSEWLRLISIFEQGYPQPKGNWPFKQLSLANVCPVCAIYEQNNPMRLYKEPSLKKNSFMSLIGVGELFAIDEVFSDFMKIGAKGYEPRDAIIHKKNQPSEKVHQLYIAGITNPGLMDTGQMRQVICRKCGTIKYYPHKKGVMRLKKGTIIPNTDFLRTNEWFGVGIVAYREVLVSNRIAQLILDKGWKGVRLKVVEFE